MTLQEAISLIDNDYLRNLPAPGLHTPYPGSPIPSFAIPPSNPSSPNPSSPHPPSRISCADLGCGSGLFTQALAHFLPAGSILYAIDRQPSIKRQTTPGGIDIIPLERDFITDPLDLPQPATGLFSANTGSPLNGILMANSLHYVKDKPAFLQNLKTYLVPDPVFLIVEYDIDKPVPTWVPYPVSFGSLQPLFHNTGYRHIKKINERPSLFGRGNLYAALVQ